jgi:AcrR family transcriptional regulator
VPKQVDPDERRRQLAEAVFAVIEARGLEAVSLRDVAAQAGVSMGQVQHWFRTKDAMLLFALGHMRDRVNARLAARIAGLPDQSPRAVIRAATVELLPLTPQARQEACVNVAFVARATVDPVYADLLRAGYLRLLEVSAAQLRLAQARGEARAGLDVRLETAAFYLLSQGLVGPLLVGAYTAEQALELLDAGLDRLFGVREPARTPSARDAGRRATDAADPGDPARRTAGRPRSAGQAPADPA